MQSSEDRADSSQSGRDPYRSPAEVSSPAHGAWLRSPIARMALAAVLAAVLVGFAVTPFGGHVVDFGGNRAGPPMELPEQLDSYDRFPLEEP